MSVQHTYTVTGMTCDHCVQAVTGELSKLPGVRTSRSIWTGACDRHQRRRPVSRRRAQRRRRGRVRVVGADG